MSDLNLLTHFLGVSNVSVLVFPQGQFLFAYVIFYMDIQDNRVISPVELHGLAG